MTDHLPPLSDEDLSAAIDGEAGSDAAERLAADPAAQARSDALAAVASQVGEAVQPLADVDVDRLIAGALLEADEWETGSVTDADSDGPAVVPITRARRRAPSPLLVAAAIVAVLGIGLAFVWSGTHGDSKADVRATGAATRSQADSAADSSKSNGESAAPTAEAGSTGKDAYAFDAASPADFGSFDSVAAFRRALSPVARRSTTLDGASSPGITTSAGGDEGTRPSEQSLTRCAVQLKATFQATEDPRITGYATIDGKPANVYVLTVPTNLEDGSEPGTTVAGVPIATETLVAAVGPDACEAISVFRP